MIGRLSNEPVSPSEIFSRRLCHTLLRLAMPSLPLICRKTSIGLRQTWKRFISWSYCEVAVVSPLCLIPTRLALMVSLKTSPVDQDSDAAPEMETMLRQARVSYAVTTRKLKLRQGSTLAKLLRFRIRRLKNGELMTLPSLYPARQSE